MSEVVEVRTGKDVSDVVEQLASSVGESSMTIPAERKIAEGEWVRFSVALEDGTNVIEGVGRCDGSIPRGNPVDRYELHLSELQFDARNEIMFERMLIAKEASEKGDDTGAIKIGDGSIEEIEDEAMADDSDVDAKPTRRSAPPPPPPIEGDKTKPDLKKPTRSSSAPKAGAKKRTSSPPPKRASKPPAKRNSSPPPKRASSPPKRASNPPKRASTPPPRKGAVLAEGPYTLEVDRELVNQARRILPRVPRKLLSRDRKPGKPEASVLGAAVRIGLAALEAIGEDD